MDRAVITLATSNRYYLELAWNLARSFKQWHNPDSLPFYIFTDIAIRKIVPPDLHWIHHVELTKGILGTGFSCKLHLDHLAPAQHTLFLDADCLICKRIDFIFEACQRKAVGVVGKEITDGEWFGDISKLRRRLRLGPLPKFNGGLYYIERGHLSRQIYQRARELEGSYDELNLVRLRNHPNDELLIAIALAEAKCKPVEDNGTILGDPTAYPCGLEIDVVRGYSKLEDTRPNLLQHQGHNQRGRIHPAVVHFLNHHTGLHPYKTQAIQLMLLQRCNCHPLLATLSAELVSGIPWRIKMFLKGLLRPVYRQFFGHRKIRSSPRMVSFNK